MNKLASLSAVVVQRRALSKSLIGRCRYLSYYSPTLTEKRVGEAGAGGRSSEAALKVAVFGALGFLGNYFACELGSNGFMTYFANDGDDMEMRHLKVNYDLGRTRFVFYSPRDKDSIREVIADADVVVNIIDSHYETGQPIQVAKFPYVSYKTNYTFADFNINIPQTLAEICRDMQVDHFVHVSSASASPDSKSEWSRTKYLGEEAVREVYPWATIVRPTQMFGRGDRLLNWFARMAQWYRCVPLLDGGTKSVIQPVYVADVAKTLLRVCDDPAKFVGRDIDCFGPTDYTYLELANFVNDITERNRPIVPVPSPAYRMIAKVLQYQRDPLITPDLVEQWSEDCMPRMTPAEYEMQSNDAKKILTMEDLEVKATPMEKVAFDYLHSYRFGGHFFRVQGYH